MRYSISLVLSFVLAATAFAQDIPLSKILAEKEGWHEGFAIPQVHFLAADAKGFIAYSHKGEKYAALRLSLAGKIESETEITLYDYVWRGATAKTQFGVTYFSDREGRGVVVVANNKKQQFTMLPAAVTVTRLALWPDEGHLVVGVHGDDHLWAYRIEADGKLGPGDRYYSLRSKSGEPMDVAAITMDAGYLLYACTPIGIQVFDPTGRLCGVVAAPTAKATMTAIAIGGEKADTLFVAAGDRIYARKIQGKAAYTLKK